MASKERACEYSRLSSLRRNAYLMEIYWYQPVHKADNKEVADNYRSISLLPFTAKWPGGGGGGTWVNVSGCASGLSVPLALYSLFLANYNPHLSHFLENVIFAIPTLSLSIFCTSTLSIWFQAAECNAVNASLLLNLINNNFLIF